MPVQAPLEMHVGIRTAERSQPSIDAFQFPDRLPCLAPCIADEGRAHTGKGTSGRGIGMPEIEMRVPGRGCWLAVR